MSKNQANDIIKLGDNAQEIIENQVIEFLLGIAKKKPYGIQRPGSKPPIELNNSKTIEKYVRYFAISSVIYTNLRGNTTLSQRDVYYCCKQYFRNQDQCNDFILEYGETFGLTRDEMRIIPASRGLCFGPLEFSILSTENDHNITQMTSARMESCISAPILISHSWTRLAQDGLVNSQKSPRIDFAVNDSEFQVKVATKCNVLKVHLRKDIKYLLVIEKEGIFKRLCEDKYFERIPCILMTACGFPDIASRAFVRVLSIVFPHLKIYALCDFNPFGFAIHMCYRFPTTSTEFESRNLHTESLKWMGIRSSHAKQLMSQHDLNCQQLSNYDERKFVSILKNLELGCCNNTNLTKQLKDEILQMKELNIKFELEELYSVDPTALQRLIERSILTNYVV